MLKIIQKNKCLNADHLLKNCFSVFTFICVASEVKCLFVETFKSMGSFPRNLELNNTKKVQNAKKGDQFAEILPLKRVKTYQLLLQSLHVINLNFC